LELSAVGNWGMMALSAKASGFEWQSLSRLRESCAQVADAVGACGIEALKRLAKVSDVITYEFENISSGPGLVKQHAFLPQGSELLS
jgi:5-(carboxyamino)imidazole ribonucleotide synthase